MFSVYECFACVSVFNHVHAWGQRRAEEGVEPLELEFQMIEIQVLGDKPRFSGTAPNVLSCQAVFPALTLNF